LAAPGAADLTAHVDFSPLLKTAQACGLKASGPVPQGVFLERLGIAQRAQALARQLDGAALEAHVAAYRRLTHPTEMGSLFQVLGLSPQGGPDIAGTVEPELDQ
ncbi:MAG: SAM-dependent methyltransferase, partial [Pseudomonadota bacterium]